MTILGAVLFGTVFVVGLLWGISPGLFFTLYGVFILIMCALIGAGVFFLVRVISPFGRHDSYYKKLLSNNKYCKNNSFKASDIIVDK